MEIEHPFGEVLDALGAGLDEAEMALLRVDRDGAARLLHAVGEVVRAHLHGGVAELVLHASADQLLSLASVPNGRDPYPRDRSAAAERLRDRLMALLTDKPRRQVGTTAMADGRIRIDFAESDAPLNAEELAHALDVARMAQRAFRALPSKPERQEDRIQLWAGIIDRVVRDHDSKKQARHSKSTRRRIAERIIVRCARASGIRRADNLFVAESKRTGVRRGPKTKASDIQSLEREHLANRRPYDAVIAVSLVQAFAALHSDDA